MMIKRRNNPLSKRPVLHRRTIASAAILITLTPSNYTAIVRGKNDTTGVALVEAYNLSP